MSEYDATAAANKPVGKKAFNKRRAAVVASAGAAAGAAAVALAHRAKRLAEKKADIIIPDGLVQEPPKRPIGERGRGVLNTIVAQSLDQRAAAELLNSSSSAIARQIRSRALYAFTFDRGVYLPKFQFHGSRIVRGLDEVLPVLDSELHPVEVVNWFTRPHTDLVLLGEAVSPVRWLETNGDVATVAGLAREAGSGL